MKGSRKKTTPPPEKAASPPLLQAEKQPLAQKRQPPLFVQQEEEGGFRWFLSLADVETHKDSPFALVTDETDEACDDANFFVQAGKALLPDTAQLTFPSPPFATGEKKLPSQIRQPRPALLLQLQQYLEWRFIVTATT